MNGWPTDIPEKTLAEVRPQTRVMQIIHGALMVGVLAFFAVQIVRGPQFSENPSAIPLIPLGLAAGGAMLSFVMPEIVRQANLAQIKTKPPITTDALVTVFQTSHLVGIAMLEGAALMSCLALTGELSQVPRWFLVVPAVLLALMAVRFPRPRSVAEWVAARREELDSEKSIDVRLHRPER